jgi:hypothetical protein
LRWVLPDLQAAVKVGAEEAARLAELSKQLSKETAELAKLRASCDGLQKKAAALQVCRFVGACIFLWGFSWLISGACVYVHACVCCCRAT